MESTIDDLSLPPLPSYEPPPETTCIPPEEYVDLETIDLSQLPLDGTINPAQRDLITKAFAAFLANGFVAVTGHGLSSTDIARQFSICSLLNDSVPEEEKHRLHARISEDGSWAGYKPKGYYQRPDGGKDYLEHYDFYPSTAVPSRLPEVAKPYLPEIRRFIEFNHYTLLRKVLALISLGLGLERDFLWDLHHQTDSEGGKVLWQEADDGKVSWKHSNDHLRYAMYHPPSEEDRALKKGLWLPGHMDIGSVSFLYSQPVSGLQILDPATNVWKYIRHYPNHVIVDFGNSMEFLTGGVLKATPHRVMEPAMDQRHLKRPGIFVFVPCLPHISLRKIDHPTIEGLGGRELLQEYFDLGGGDLRSDEWYAIKSKLVGTARVKRPERVPMAVIEDIHFRYNPS